MSEWIPVCDAIPDNSNWEKFEVKITIGSMQKKQIERVCLGKTGHGYYRWAVGDWEIVTHWKK